MRSKIKFLKLIERFPQKVRRELVYNFVNNPMSLNVCYMEVKHDTKAGKKILKDLGFEGNLKG